MKNQLTSTTVHQNLKGVRAMFRKTSVICLGIFMFIAITSMVLAPPAFADGWWNSSANDDWSNTSKWAYGYKPGASDTVYIGYAGFANPSEVKITSTQAAGNVFLGWNSGTSGKINMMTGGTLNSGNIYNGYVLNSTGTMTMTGGTINAPYMQMASVANSRGNMNITGGTYNGSSIDPGYLVVMVHIP
jgi:hypothetical protein